MNSHSGKIPFRSHGLLMELTFVCGFFLAAACVFILVFVKAGRLSSAAENISASVNAAQTIVETVLPEEGQKDGEKNYFIFFDENWNPSEPAGLETASGSFRALADVTETWQDGLVHIQVIITSAGGEELYRLTADRDFS